MFKGQRKGFISGILVATLVFAMLGTALAATTVKTLQANYSGIKITLDGKEIVPTDANGVAVEPFAVDGTTYLPVRAISNALGLDVEWDGTTQTVMLANPAPSGGATGQPAGTVLMDMNGIKITFLGIAERTSLLSGYDIKVRIENSTSKNYTVQVRNLSINGMMLSTSIFSSTVAAGKSANDAIWVYGLEDAGITSPITAAEFYFHVFNDDDWMDDFDSEVIEIKP